MIDCIFRYTNNTNRCHGLVSVFRMEVDKCDRLWVLDTGAINLASGVEQLCPLKIDVFDLKTDRLVKRFIVPSNQTSKDSLFTNIVVEIINDNCEDAYAYISDVFQYGLIVYDYKKVTCIAYLHLIIIIIFALNDSYNNTKNYKCNFRLLYLHTLYSSLISYQTSSPKGWFLDRIIERTRSVNKAVFTHRSVRPERRSAILMVANNVYKM